MSHQQEQGHNKLMPKNIILKNELDVTIDELSKKNKTWLIDFMSK